MSAIQQAVLSYGTRPPVISLNFDAGNGSTTFTDAGSAGSTWGVAAGSPVCSTATILAGVSSLSIPSNTATISTPYVTANMIPQTGDWSVSFLARIPSWAPGSVGTTIFAVEDASGTAAGTVIRFATNSTGGVAIVYSDGTTRSVASGAVLTANANNAYVMKRVGNTISITENGTTMHSVSFSGSLNGVPSGSPTWRIGAPLSSASAGPVNAFVDNFIVQR